MVLVVAGTTGSASASVLVRGDHASVKLTCTAGSTHACTGVMSLRRKVGGEVRGLGKQRYSIAPGRASTVRIKLNELALGLLERQRAVGATLHWKTRGAPASRKPVRLVRS
jgi:hypothetical protein